MAQFISLKLVIPFFHCLVTRWRGPLSGSIALWQCTMQGGLEVEFGLYMSLTGTDMLPV